MAVLYGRAGRLTAQNGGFRRGQKQADASLHDIFVVGTRGRGIYCTLPQVKPSLRLRAWLSYYNYYGGL